MLGFFLKLVSGWKLLTNPTKSSILAVAMVLDTSLCFFRKPSNAICFIIKFNIRSQIRTLWKYCHVQRERDDKNKKILGREFMPLSQKYEEYWSFPFSHDVILKQNYIVIFILSSLVNICQNHNGLY